MSLIQGKTIHGLRSTALHMQWNTLPRDFGQERVLWGLRWGNLEIGHDWLEGQGFPYKTSTSSCLGSDKLSQAELEDRDWGIPDFLDSEAFPISSGWLRFRFVTWAGSLGRPPLWGSQATKYLCQELHGCFWEEFQLYGFSRFHLGVPLSP